MGAIVFARATLRLGLGRNGGGDDRVDVVARILAGKTLLPSNEFHAVTTEPDLKNFAIPVRGLLLGCVFIIESEVFPSRDGCWLQSDFWVRR